MSIACIPVVVFGFPAYLSLDNDLLRASLIMTRRQYRSRFFADSRKKYPQPTGRGYFLLPLSIL
jgi:hypothetical protein